MAGLGGLFAPRGLGRHGRQRLDGLAVQHAGALVEADHRVLRIAGSLVDGQHVLHAGHEGRVHFAQAPVLLAVGPPRLLSAWLTVSREMVSTSSSSTALSASRCRVQRLWPTGAGVQASAVTAARWNPVKRGSPLLRGASARAACQPASS
jgi:hypothetical protein